MNCINIAYVDSNDPCNVVDILIRFNSIITIYIATNEFNGKLRFIFTSLISKRQATVARKDP